MLQHRSGIPNFVDHPEYLWFETLPTHDAYLAFAIDEPADFEPDKRYSYSNTNYLLIGNILDKVLGYSHHQYIESEILEPLRLSHTYSLLSEVDSADLASGYHYEGRYYTEHSEFSRTIDIRIDFENVMQQMAEKYMDSHAHLIALYYITTEVSPDDAAELAGRGGTKKSWWLTSIVKPIREELAELLGVFVPTKLDWKKRYVSGDEAPFWGVVDKFKGRQSHRMVEVMCGMAEDENCKSMASRLDLPLHMIHMYRRKAHEELRKAYRCSA